MILTQKMIDKLQEWKAKDQDNIFVACFLPLEFTEKYMPDWLITRNYQPVTDIKILTEMVNLEDFYITITRGRWQATVESEDDNFELLVALEKEKYYTERLMESILEKQKIQGVA